MMWEDERTSQTLPLTRTKRLVRIARRPLYLYYTGTTEIVDLHKDRTRSGETVYHISWYYVQVYVFYRSLMDKGRSTESTEISNAEACCPFWGELPSSVDMSVSCINFSISAIAPSTVFRFDAEGRSPSSIRLRKNDDVSRLSSSSTPGLFFALLGCVADFLL